MIRVTECRIQCCGGVKALEERLRRTLRMNRKQWERCTYTIVRHSVDARKKPSLKDVYTVDVDTGLGTGAETSLVRRLRSGSVSVRPLSIPVPI